MQVGQLKALALAAMVVVATAPWARAANTTVIYDHFDDGVIGTNTMPGGVGSGFENSAPVGGGVANLVESGTTLSMTKSSGVASGFNIMSVSSDDSFSAFGTGSTTLIEWKINGGYGFVDGNNTNPTSGDIRAWLGIRKAGTSVTSGGNFYFPFGGSVNTGLYISIAGDHSIIPGDNFGTYGDREGRIVYYNGTAQTLAAWDWTTPELSPGFQDMPDDLTVQLRLNGSNYTLTLLGSDSVVTNFATNTGATLLGSTITGTVTNDIYPTSLNVGVSYQEVTNSAGTPKEGLDFDRILVITDIQPALVTTPANGQTLDFGNVRLGTTATAVLTASNGGNDDGLVGDFPAGIGEFSAIGTLPFGPLNVGANATRTYTYTPSDQTADTVDHNVTTTNGGDSTVTFAGDGVTPIFSSNFGTGGTVNFGDVISMGSATQTITITNTTGDPIILGDLVRLTYDNNDIFGGEWSLLMQTGDGILDPLEVASYTLVFTGDGTLGVSQFTFTIETDQNAAFGGDGQDFIFTLEANEVSGTIVPEPASLALVALAGLALARRRR